MNPDDAFDLYSGLDGYGIPYEVLALNATGNHGAALPELITSGVGNYGGFITLSELSYEQSAGVYASAMTDAQWQSIYDYQTAYGVRLARLDAYPGWDFGVSLYGSGGCCIEADDIQYISISNSTAFKTAGYKSGGKVPTTGLWHYGATISRENTWAIATLSAGGSFTGESVSAVINVWPNGNGVREQMVWFTRYVKTSSIHLVKPR